MNDEIEFVRAQLNTFSAKIAASGIDVRVIVISGALAASDKDAGSAGNRDDNAICVDAPLGSGSSYLEAHSKVSAAYIDANTWSKQAILNVARVGHFSSDRTVREYSRDIWGIEPC